MMLVSPVSHWLSAGGVGMPSTMSRILKPTLMVWVVEVSTSRMAVIGQGRR